MYTIGISPKVVAASITAYVAPIVVGFAATKLGVTIDIDTVTAFVGPLALAGITFAVSFLAKPGLVTNTDDVAVEQGGHVTAKR
jgi:hypothetical protein